MYDIEFYNWEIVWEKTPSDQEVFRALWEVEDGLMGKCRNIIRETLTTVQGNLPIFGLVEKLGLPPIIAKYLVFNCSL